MGIRVPWTKVGIVRSSERPTRQTLKSLVGIRTLCLYLFGLLLLLLSLSLDFSTVPLLSDWSQWTKPLSASEDLLQAHSVQNLSTCKSAERLQVKGSFTWDPNPQVPYQGVFQTDKLNEGIRIEVGPTGEVGLVLGLATSGDWQAVISNVVLEPNSSNNFFADVSRNGDVVLEVNKSQLMAKTAPLHWKCEQFVAGRGFDQSRVLRGVHDLEYRSRDSLASSTVGSLLSTTIAPLIIGLLCLITLFLTRHLIFFGSQNSDCMWLILFTGLLLVSGTLLISTKSKTTSVWRMSDNGELLLDDSSIIQIGQNSQHLRITIHNARSSPGTSAQLPEQPFNISLSDGQLGLSGFVTSNSHLFGARPFDNFVLGAVTLPNPEIQIVISNQCEIEIVTSISKFSQDVCPSQILVPSDPRSGISFSGFNYTHIEIEDQTSNTPFRSVGLICLYLFLWLLGLLIASRLNLLSRTLFRGSRTDDGS